MQLRIVFKEANAHNLFHGFMVYRERECKDIV